MKLDEYENAIESGLGDTASVNNLEVEITRAREAAQRFARKNKTITLRVSEYDLQAIKQRAAREGMPYQTLIHSVMHKYVTDQLQ